MKIVLSAIVEKIEKSRIFRNFPPTDLIYTLVALNWRQDHTYFIDVTQPVARSCRSASARSSICKRKVFMSRGTR
jgi:hypothetical protein